MERCSRPLSLSTRRRRGGPLGALVAAAVLSWASGAARGATPSAERTAVLVYRAPQAPASLGLVEVAQELRQALVLRGLRVEPASSEETASSAPNLAIGQALRGRQALLAHGGRPPEAQLMALGGVKELLLAGRAQLGRVELELAEATFADAERRLWETPLPTEATALLAEALRWRGVALWELKRASAAEAAFRQALALQPQAALTEADVRPEVVAAFQRAAQAASSQEPIALRITPQVAAQSGAAPSDVPAALQGGLTVTVDGAEVPLAQGSVERALLPGVHLITARLLGHQPATRALRLPIDRSDASADLRLVLVADPPQAALMALRAAPATEGLAALCAELGLSSVVVASSAEEGALVGQRYRCAAGSLTRAARAPLSPPPPGPALTLAARATALVDLLWQSPAAAGQGIALWSAAPLVPRPLPKARARSLWTRPWPYLAGAVVASGVLLGVFLWPRPAPQLQVSLNPESFP